jgi:hypothetical protein
MSTEITERSYLKLPLPLAWVAVVSIATAGVYAGQKIQKLDDRLGVIEAKLGIQTEARK